MPRNLFSIRQFRLTKWSFLVHSTARNAPYIHLSYDSILELWRSFPNVLSYDKYERILNVSRFDLDVCMK